MNNFEIPPPGWEWGFWGSRKREGLGSAKGMKGAGSGSFLQEAVGGVLIAMMLQFTQLLLLQGQHRVHLQLGRGGTKGRRDLTADLTAPPCPGSGTPSPYHVFVSLTSTTPWLIAP